MRLTFVNRFYWPETPATGQLLTDLAEALAARGHEVAVVTSHSGAAGLPSTETRNQVHITRVRGTRWADAGSAGKAMDFATFLFLATWRLLVVGRRGDTFVPMTDPPMLGLGVWLVARVRRARVIHWVQDIYPEIAIELTGHRWLAALKPWRNLSWRHADRCVTLGRDMGSVLTRCGVDPARLGIVPNAAPIDLDLEPVPSNGNLRTEWSLQGKFVVAYSGNLGRVHDLDPVIELADRLRDAAEITFLFIGDGPRRPALEREAVRRGLRNVQFRPTQPRARLAEALALGQVHLVTLQPGCEHYVFPSKFYGIVAAGRPIVFIGPASCELAETVRTRGLGLVFGRDEVETLAEALRRLVRHPESCREFEVAARRFATEERGQAVARWTALLAGLEACGNGVPRDMPATTT